ncbi:MAG: hypothetical protein KF895_03320 [Parvibaculum sp.]|nr:hypothetical protein [Parvibaculum sp.]
MLKLIPPSPAAFGPAWHARSEEPPEVAPARCCFCDRDIAVKASEGRLTAACIYCAIDAELIPAIDEPFFKD